jgi:histidinol-phosphate aminotransferase
MEFNILNLIRTSIIDIQPYSSARNEFEGEASVYLDANENPYPTNVNRYPDPLQLTLKQRIAEIEEVDVDQIFLGNGSDEVIDLCFRAFCEPGKDRAVSIAPSYGMYSVSAKINDVTLDHFLLNLDFSLDVNALLAFSKGAKFLFLCSPNNPTGNTFSREIITKICTEFEGLVIVDEAYIDFANSPSSIALLSTFKNLMVCQTFSKAYGMAGIRLGKAFAHPETISWLNKIKPPYNLGSLTINYALEKLSDLFQHEYQKNEILNERKDLFQFLNAQKSIVTVFPSEANFILFRVENADKLYSEMINAGLVVRNRSKQPLCENCLRISIGTPEENQKVKSFFELIELKNN